MSKSERMQQPGDCSAAGRVDQVAQLNDRASKKYCLGVLALEGKDIKRKKLDRIGAVLMDVITSAMITGTYGHVGVKFPFRPA